MSHKRIKNIDYDDDDDYYSEDEDTYPNQKDDFVPEQTELTEYDKEQLRAGTVKVKSQLGPLYQASEKEIHDALWHYYYDIGKTVTYLKNNSSSQSSSSTKVKQLSRFDQAAGAAAVSSSPKPVAGFLAEPNDLDMDGPHTTRLVPQVQDDLGWETESESESERSTLQYVLQAPRLHLRGGSSKTSKLAALAAARKKKESEKLAAANTGSSTDGTDKATSLLSQLSVRPGQTQGDISTRDVTTNIKASSVKNSFPLKARQEEPKETEPASLVAKTLVSDAAPAAPTPSRPSIRVAAAGPSDFAQAIFGIDHSPPEGVSLAGFLDHTRVMPIQHPTFTFPPAGDLPAITRNPFAGPSPDDLVLNAQSKAKNLTTQKTKPNGATSDIAKGVSNLSVQDLPKPRSKNLNVLDEFRKAKLKNSASFVVVGHVDHGKSTLIGRLLYDLKVVDEKTVEKLRRESKKIGKSSFALAWVMDSTSDERQHGVTVDIATNYFETETTKFTILDAPGHQDFVPNMISGASQADFAVLVIDASTNSFEAGLRGQTKEHALLVRSMGVQRLIVAVNKMDMANWSEERFTEIVQQMTAFLTSANFSPNNITFVPCAGLTGENIVTPIDKAEAKWYKGNSLVAELETVEPTKRALEKPLRMTISDVFSSSPNNPVSVAGRIDAGSLQIGDTVKILPSGEQAVIRSLDADNTPSDWAVAGQLVTLNLADADPQNLRTGDILCSVKDPVSNVKIFAAKILAFEHVFPMFLEVHRGPLRTEARITQLVATLDKVSGETIKKKPKVLQPGAVARVMVELVNELPLEAGSRVIFRNDGKSVAAGLVE